MNATHLAMRETELAGWEVRSNFLSVLRHYYWRVIINRLFTLIDLDQTPDQVWSRSLVEIRVGRSHLRYITGGWASRPIQPLVHNRAAIPA